MIKEETKYHKKEKILKKRFLEKLYSIGSEFKEWKKKNEGYNNQMILIIVKFLEPITNIKLLRQCKRSSDALSAFLELHWRIFKPFFENMYIYNYLNDKFVSESDSFQNILREFQNSHEKKYLKEKAQKLFTYFQKNDLICSKIILLFMENSIIPIPLIKSFQNNSNQLSHYLFLSESEYHDWLNLFKIKINIKLPPISTFIDFHKIEN